MERNLRKYEWLPAESNEASEERGRVGEGIEGGVTDKGRGEEGNVNPDIERINDWITIDTIEKSEAK